MATRSQTPVSARTRITPSIDERVQNLRDLAETDPVNAQDAAWAWFTRLGQLTAVDRVKGEEQLDRLFAQGAAPAPIDGTAEGMMIAYLFGGPYDFAMRKIGALWMPWLGKRFDAAGSRGENRITDEFRYVTRAVWPRYATRRVEGERRGFEFETRIERGAVEPAVSVLVIDYQRAPRNPRRIVPSIRDELVQIVPGTFMGRALWRRGGGGGGEYKNMGFFALRNSDY